MKLDDIKEIANILPDYILLIDQDYNIVFANKLFLDFCGLKEKELINKKCYEFSHNCPKPCKECLKDIVCPNEDTSESGIVHCHIMPDGTKRIFDIRTSKLKDYNLFLQVIRDITENEKCREELEKKEKKLNNITSNVAEGIYTLDLNGCLTYMNPEAERLLGWEERELLNKKIHNIIHFKKADGSLCAEEDCLLYKSIKEGKRYYSNEEIFVRKDGTEFPVSLLSSPIINNGQVVGSISIFRDMSISKKFEEEILRIQKLESIAALTKGISHDFNNLLTAIMGYISLSKSELKPEDRIYNYLSIAENACVNAKNLMYQLVVFAKGSDLVKKKIDIRSLLIDTAYLSVSGSNCNIDFSISDDLWLVEIDEAQIKQVINNIIMNACEAMPGGGTISITADNFIKGESDALPLKNGKYVRIAIKDQGIGISKDNMKKIFDPYFTTKNLDFNKGVGLGLAVSYAIMKRHDGYIYAESEIGKGSIFYLFIPAIEIITEKSNIQTIPDLQMRIFLVEDEEMVGSVTKDMLEHIGYSVDFVHNGEEAIDLYKKAMKSGKAYFAVILDLTICKGMGGKETIKQLINIDPNINAIITSAYTDDPVMINFRDYGFKAALKKPYDIITLEEVFKKIRYN